MIVETGKLGVQLSFDNVENLAVNSLIRTSFIYTYIRRIVSRKKAGIMVLVADLYYYMEPSGDAAKLL